MKRLDFLCFEKGLADSRTKSKNLILDGRVSVNGKIVRKPSELVNEECEILVSRPEKEYVSRGAYKLIGALDVFEIDIAEKNAIDIGASTGGFTQVLLERGINKVYAVDVGKGQLHSKIKENKKVISMEETNARTLKKSDFSDEISIAVMDVSFISQTLLYGSISDILVKNGVLVSLVKPQFEVGKANIGKGGIVKNEKLYDKVKEKIISCAKEFGLILKGYIPSPIEGGDGNKEFLAYFVNEGETHFE